jgi:hypothetical protein
MTPGAAAVAALAALSLAVAAAEAAAVAAAAERVVLIVVDQLRADQLDRRPLPRIAALARAGTRFTDAIVGHLAAETIVSHPVIATGWLPRRLPWGDEVLADERGALGRPGLLHLSTALALDRMERLLEAAPGGPDADTLPRVIRRTRGGRVYAIGSKSYAACGMGAAGADSVVFLSDPMKTGPWAGYRRPDGRGVPSWIAGPPGNRFHVDGRRTYGTAHLEYPMKGDHYLPGPDARRPGGDLWVAGVALEVMRRDPGWTGLLLTMGGVDKVGHLLGEFDGPVEAGQDPAVHLDRALATADRAVGRVLDRLAELGLADRTLVVLTSDHGALAGRFVGDRGPGRANENWYCGRAENARYARPSRAIAPLAALPQVRFVMADTMIRAWLADGSLASVVATGRAMRALEGVREVHGLIGSRYMRLHRRSDRDSGGVPDREAAWAARELPELLASLAAPHAPHVLGLLDSGVTYGTPGDHGGHQELVQRIPLIFRGPGLGAGRTSRERARLVDIAPTVAALLGAAGGSYDGRVLDVAGR